MTETGSIFLIGPIPDLIILRPTSDIENGDRVRQ